MRANFSSFFISSESRCVAVSTSTKSSTAIANSRHSIFSGPQCTTVFWAKTTSWTTHRRENQARCISARNARHFAACCLSVQSVSKFLSTLISFLIKLIAMVLSSSSSPSHTQTWLASVYTSDIIATWELRSSRSSWLIHMASIQIKRCLSNRRYFNARPRVSDTRFL